ncbi:MAG: SigF/SigG family RNA polymerase sporulation sigma factor [Lachnospiraceae bacterium]|nr:SigF/SigG family RNA polymerase sporulation sigma factor [Lachnospiraceae bacterium]
MEEISVRIAKAQSGDKHTREVLIEENLGLVHHIVRRFLGRGYDAEDLFQIGTIGLMKAIDKFDLSFDVKFSTYAVPMISGEIKRFLRDDGMVKVGRTLKENGFKVKAVSERLAQSLGREATLEEVSKETGLLVEEVVMALEAGAEVESIYKSVYQADGSEIFLIDKLATEDKEKETMINQMLVRQLLDELDEQERELITLRFFGEQTQMEVARKLGISQVQVSRLEKKILIGMRQRVT